jgi:hypothetical protein
MCFTIYVLTVRLKSSVQRESRRVWKSTNDRYFVVCGDRRFLSFDEAAILYVDFNSAPS